MLLPPRWVFIIVPFADRVACTPTSVYHWMIDRATPLFMLCPFLSPLAGLPGYYCPRNSPVAHPCPDGNYSSGGAVTCLPCGAGYYCPLGSTAANSTLCPAGRYCPAGAPSAACAAGSFSATGAAVCSPCPRGRYSATGATACTPYNCAPSFPNKDPICSQALADVEQAALAELYNATLGAVTWVNTTGWVNDGSSGDQCIQTASPWFGVTCQRGTPGHVV